MPEVPQLSGRSCLPIFRQNLQSCSQVVLFWLEAPLPMNTAVRTRGLAYGTIDSRRAQSHRGPRWDPSNGSRSDLVKKPRFCGFFSGGEQRFFKIDINCVIRSKNVRSSL